MKKLMVAIVSAASAIFAFGDLPHGADFEAEGFVVGESFTNYLDKGDGAVSEGTLYWEASISGEEIGTIAEYTGTGRIGVDDVPDIYTNALTNAKYLQLDSGKNRLLRNIDDGGAAVPMSTGDGIYLDTLVKFSAASSLLDSDFESGDKLAIAYVGDLEEGNEVIALSNFVVRAGFVGELQPTNYLVEVANFDVENWHRLTIRTLTNIDGAGRAGFKIYLDGQVLAYSTGDDRFAQAAGFNDATHTIFPSALAAGQTGADTISAVAFAGNGSIDDVVFTTETPKFIKDTESVVATFTVDSGVTAISVQVGSAEPIVVDMNNLEAILPPGTDEFTVTATIDGDNDYTFAKMTYGGVDYNTNPATITGYAGGAIAITTTRNNFSLFDGNNDPITGTFQTLAEALAAQGVAKIQLANDYTVADWEDNFAGYTIDQNIVLDLNGKTINGGSSNSKCMFAVVLGYTLTVVNSVDSDNGKIVYGGTAGVFDGNDGDVVLGSTSVTDYGLVVDGAVMGERGYVTCIYRGKFLAALNSTEGNEFICDTDDESGIQVVDGDSETSLAGAYWVVTPQSTPQPTKIAVPTAASNLVYDGEEQTGVAAGEGYTLSGDFKATNAGEYTATATLEDGYIWSDDSTEAKSINWSIAADTSATVVVTLTDYEEEYTAQLAFPTASATIGGNAVAGTSVWNPDTITEPSAAGVTNTYEVTFTVTGGNYAGSTGTAEFKVWKAAGGGGGDWPADPTEVSGQTAADAFGITGDLATADAGVLATWAKAKGVDYSDRTTEILTDAFLLDCANTQEAIDAAKANFKVTSITVVGDTVTITPADAADYGNGQIVIEGATAITSPMSWHPKTTGDHFFRATLVVKPVTP